MTLTLGTHNLRYTPSDWPSLVFLPLSKLTITPHDRNALRRVIKPDHHWYPSTEH